MHTTDLGLAQKSVNLAKSGRLSWVKLKLFIQKETSYLNYDQPQDLLAHKFLAYCRNLLASSDHLRREFQLLASLALERSQPTHVAVQGSNRTKNRYINVLPYDNTRVILHRDNPAESDYINASFIKGFSNEAEYIAAQGPKPDTIADFWSMVLQYRVTKIAMLCSFFEKGRVKCEKYFPDRVNEYFVFGNIRVGCTYQSVNAYYTSTHLRITRDSDLLEVQHFHLRDWQDFSIPGGPEVLINFCQLVRNSTPSSQLTVVHCSAGVGRTGTYIACDILLQRLQHNRKLNVFRSVLDLREQRAHMVQSEAQYLYLYQSISCALESSDHVKLKSGETTPTSPSKESGPSPFQDRTAEISNPNSLCKTPEFSNRNALFKTPDFSNNNSLCKTPDFSNNNSLCKTPEFSNNNSLCKTPEFNNTSSLCKTPDFSNNNSLCKTPECSSNISLSRSPEFSHNDSLCKTPEFSTNNGLSNSSSTDSGMTSR